MKFTIERATLLKTLSHVQSIVEKRNTIPVLSNVKIEALADGISFKATDMDTEITEIVDAKVEEQGATTAPAHMLYDIVRKLSDGSEVELTFPDEKLVKELMKPYEEKVFEVLGVNYDTSYKFPWNRLFEVEVCI